MNPLRLLLALVLGAAFAATSCTSGDADNCADLESWLENRARELDRTCDTDDDCFGGDCIVRAAAHEVPRFVIVSPCFARGG